MFESIITQESILIVLGLSITTCLIAGVFEMAFRIEKMGDEEK
jgi:hypothetical protein